MRSEIVPCMECGHDAKRIAKGIENDTYKCTKCSKQYIIDWEHDMSEPPGPLELRAKVVLSKIEPQTRFEIEFFLTNNTEESITVMRPGDGSEMGWRPPKINVTVYRSGHKKWESFDRMRNVGRCGVMNPLTDYDFVTIKPGESMNITGWVWLPIAKELGTYLIEVEFENDPTMRTRVGAPTPELMERMRKSFKCKIKSNMVKIEVVRDLI